MFQKQSISYKFCYASLLALILISCSKKSDSDSGLTTPVAKTSVTGIVTYTRIPLLKNTSGVPIGLETNSANYVTGVPAPGINVRAYEYVTETPATGSSFSYWQLAANTQTNTEGKYSFSVPQGKPIMVQLASEYTYSGSSSTQDPINLIADPNGMESTVLATKRLRYVIRKALDSTPATSTNLTPSSSSSNTTATVDFTVGLTDKWILSDISMNPNTGIASSLSSATMETSGSGSRILAILGTVNKFKDIYKYTESFEILDLHYSPGRRETRGSYVDYDRLSYPKASTGNNAAYDFDTGRLHYFGSISGSSSNDDAWDESIIMGLIARNSNFGYIQSVTPLISGILPVMPTLSEALTLTNLHPMLAHIEAQGDLMVASVLKSPYLYDIFLGGISVRDIRNIGALSTSEKGPYSAPSLKALGWEVILKANSITSPGSPVDWDKIDFLKSLKYLSTSFDSSSSDCPNIYRQLARLQEAKVASDTVDLASIFPDSVLTPFLQTFNITWPRPLVNSVPVTPFVRDYNALSYTFGATTVLPPISFSMENAQTLNGSYPNATSSEIALARLSVSVDTAYYLTVTPSIGLPAGSVVLDIPTAGYKFTYPGSGNPSRIVLRSSSGIHVFIYRINSPLSKLPAHTVTVTLTPTN